MEAESDVDLATRQALFEQVRRHTGIAMNERKWLMLQGRLRRRLHTLSLTCFSEYVRLLKDEPGEVPDFVDLVTTNETSFFRTPRIWDYFANEFLPKRYAASPHETLKLWSAAASSGEEALSAAMLCEEFRARHPAFRYQILATDISGAVLQHAATGQYKGRNALGLRTMHPMLADKYFEVLNDGIAASPALLAHITFRQHNLFEPLRGARAFDFALLRNVLIYFDEAGQQAVLQRVHDAMAVNAVLVIGESESLSRLKTGFTFERPLIYLKQAAHVECA